MEVALAYTEEAPPLSIFVTAAVAGISIKADPKLPSGSLPTFCFPSGYAPIVYIMFSSDLRIILLYLLARLHICMIVLHFFYCIISIYSEI
jgi:hypothetical protein